MDGTTTPPSSCALLLLVGAVRTRFRDALSLLPRLLPLQKMVLLIAMGTYQVRHLKQFFKAKRLV